MEMIPTYIEYQMYGGKLSESIFRNLITKAVRTVSAMTLGRSEKPPKSMEDRVKQCICEIVEIKSFYSQRDEILPRGIQSVTNDRLSVSRSTSGESGEQSDCEEVCRIYLTRPLNLMYRGIGYAGI